MRLLTRAACFWGVLFALLSGAGVACERRAEVAKIPEAGPVKAASAQRPASVAEPSSRTALALLSPDAKHKPPANPEAFLEAHVRRWALKDPKNPWALTHALPIVGPEAKLAGGQTVLQAILASATFREVGATRYPAFVGRAPDGTPLEPHRDLVAAALLLAKVPAQTPFPIQGEATTVGALYEGMRQSFEPSAEGRLGADAWTLSALSALPGAIEAFKNHRGQRVDPLALARAAAADLERENAFLQQVRTSGVPLQKRRQGIFAEPCGGFHYLEAAARYLPAAKGPALSASLARTLELTLFRLRAEAALYDRTHRQAPARYQRLLWIQELKFFGHTLEALGVLRDGGLVIRPEAVAFARRRLLRAIEALQQLGAFEKMEAVNAVRHQSYLDLIGDSAHALLGLRAWPEPGR